MLVVVLFQDVNNAFKQGEVGHCDFPGNNGAGSRDVPKDIVSAGYLNIGEIWVLASATGKHRFYFSIAQFFFSCSV